MLSNSRKSSPIPLPLRELKDAEIYLNTPTCDKENSKPSQQQSSQPYPAKGFRAPIVKTVTGTNENDNRTDALRNPTRTDPGSVTMVKKFDLNFKPEPKIVDSKVPCPSLESKRFFRAVYTK